MRSMRSASAASRPRIAPLPKYFGPSKCSDSRDQLASASNGTKTPSTSGCMHVWPQAWLEYVTPVGHGTPGPAPRRTGESEVSMVRLQKDDRRLAVRHDPFGGSVGETVREVVEIEAVGLREVNGSIALPEGESVVQGNPSERLGTEREHEPHRALGQKFSN